MGSGGGRKLFSGQTAYWFAFAALWGAGAAQASPWPRPDDEILIVSRADYFESDLGELSVSGEPVEGRFQRIESNTYAEFGLTEDLTVGGKVFYGTSWLTRGADVETASGFTEIEGFAHYQVFKSGRHVGSVKMAAGLPASFKSGARPELQSNGVDVELAALYARELVLSPVRIYAAAEIGYRKRFSASADQARLVTTLGAEPSERWLILLDTYSVKSVENERAGGADFDIVKIQPSLVWRATRRFHVQAGVTEEIAGRNIALGRTYFLGVWTRF